MDSDFIEERAAEFDQLTVDQKLRFSKSVQDAFDNGAEINEAEKLRELAIEWTESNEKVARNSYFLLFAIALVFSLTEFFGFEVLPLKSAWAVGAITIIFGVGNEIFAHVSRIQKLKVEATLGYLRQRPHLKYGGRDRDYSDNDRWLDAHTLRKLLFRSKTEVQWHEFDFLRDDDDTD